MKTIIDVMTFCLHIHHLSLIAYNNIDMSNTVYRIWVFVKLNAVLPTGELKISHNVIYVQLIPPSAFEQSWTM